MKNYLVKTLFKVKSPDWHVHDRSHEDNLYDDYLEMHRISLGSAKKFLQGDWEFKFLGGDVEDINQAFEKTFWFIHDLWHSESCNILYTDPDTIFVRPLNIFGRCDIFRMFNYTDPKEFSQPNIYNRQFNHFFNAGVRYFPSSMSKDIWNLGADMAKNWVHNDYNTEQIILNAMLWDQGVTPEQMIQPQVAWQMLTGDIEFGNTWNKVPITEAAILHLHGSRYAKSRVAFMQEIEKKT